MFPKCLTTTNLTRVECKYIFLSYNITIQVALILPEWNVNIFNLSLISNYSVALILPEWNVNFYLFQSHKIELCFNLTRVECKYHQKNYLILFVFALILPEWNVNVGDYHREYVLGCGFNLTRVECKYG